MANVVVTITIMPESDASLSKIEEKATAIIKKHSQGDVRVEQKPIAFGLKSIIFTFLMQEEKGSTEHLDNELSSIDGVSRAETTDVRRALG